MCVAFTNYIYISALICKVNQIKILIYLLVKINWKNAYPSIPGKDTRFCIAI